MGWSCHRTVWYPQIHRLISFLYWHFWEYWNTPCFDMYIYIYIYILYINNYIHISVYIYIYDIQCIYIYMVVLSTYNLQFVWRHSEVDFLASSRCVHCPQEHKEKDPVRRSPGGTNSADFDLKPWVETMSFANGYPATPKTMCPQLTQFPLWSRHSLHSERSQVQLISVVSIGLSSTITRFP